MKLRERVRLPDRNLLHIRKVNTGEIADVEITQDEHDNIDSATLTAKVIAEKRTPPGKWEHNSGGAVKSGGRWTFDDVETYDFPIGDITADPVSGDLFVQLEAGEIYKIPLSNVAVMRGSTGGLTVKDKTSGLDPADFSLIDGTFTDKRGG